MIEPHSPRWLVLWALALFAAALAVHSRHRDFAWFYHPDEGEKVRQVQTGEWNYHHPMLLLSASKVAVNATGAREPQAVVEVGRAVSAAFTALAVVALSLLAFAWRGWHAAIAAGAALLLHHQLYELSHYMKEDTALLLGLALAWLAALHFERAPSVSRAVLLGAACALAISGKYIGVLALIVAVPALWRAGGKARAGAFLGALVLVLVVVNLPLLANFADFRASLARETDLVVKGQGGMTQRVPHADYLKVFVANTTPAIWLLLAIFLAARWRERRALTPVRWHLIAFPFLYALALSFSPKSNDRYFLPATALLTLFAGMGVVDAARLLRRKWTACAATALLVVSQVCTLPGDDLDWRTFTQYRRAFLHDDSRELLEWCRSELPADAVIAKDSRVWLPDPKKPGTAAAIPQKVLAAKYAADLGTLDELRARGVTHVAVSESDYGRYFRTSLRPRPGEEADYQRRKTFYETLLREGEMMFDRDRGTVIYLHPGIRVYRIAR